MLRQILLNLYKLVKEALCFLFHKTQKEFKSVILFDEKRMGFKVMFTATFPQDILGAIDIWTGF